MPTYYLMINPAYVFNEPITFTINNCNLTVNWKKDPTFQMMGSNALYYHEETVFSNEAIRLHTIKLIKHLEERTQSKINYRLTKKVVLENVDPEFMGYVF